MKTRIPTHPGAILKDELTELGLSAHTLSMNLGVPASFRSLNVNAGYRPTPPFALQRILVAHRISG